MIRLPVLAVFDQVNDMGQRYRRGRKVAARLAVLVAEHLVIRLENGALEHRHDQDAFMRRPKSRALFEDGVHGCLNLGVSGGPAGFAATITFTATGQVPTYTIVSPGISTSNAAPTLTLPSGVTLSGSAVPTATVATIPVNTVFAAPDSTGTMLYTWSNAAGTLTQGSLAYYLTPYILNLLGGPNLNSGVTVTVPAATGATANCISGYNYGCSAGLPADGVINSVTATVNVLGTAEIVFGYESPAYTFVCVAILNVTFTSLTQTFACNIPAPKGTRPFYRRSGTAGYLQKLTGSSGSNDGAKWFVDSTWNGSVGGTAPMATDFCNPAIGYTATCYEGSFRDAVGYNNGITSDTGTISYGVTGTPAIAGSSSYPGAGRINWSNECTRFGGETLTSLTLPFAANQPVVGWILLSTLSGTNLTNIAAVQVAVPYGGTYTAPASVLSALMAQVGGTLPAGVYVGFQVSSGSGVVLWSGATGGISQSEEMQGTASSNYHAAVGDVNALTVVSGQFSGLSFTTSIPKAGSARLAADEALIASNTAAITVLQTPKRDSVVTYNTRFPGTSTPTGWTLQSGATINEGLTATGTSSWSTWSRYGSGVSVLNRREVVGQLTLNDNTTVIAGIGLDGGVVGTSIASGEDFGSTAMINCTNGYFEVYNWNGGVGSTTLAAQVPVGAGGAGAFSTSILYSISIWREGMQTTYTLWNAFTGSKLAQVVLVNSAIALWAAIPRGSLSAIVYAGTATFTTVMDKMRASKRMQFAFLADSNIEGNPVPSMNPTWAQQFNLARNRNDVVLFADGGDATNYLINRATDLKLAAQADNVVISLVTNAASLAAFQSTSSGLPAIVAAIQGYNANANIIIVNGPPRTAGGAGQSVVTSINAWLVTYCSANRLQLFDLAKVLSQNNDGVTAISSYLYVDGTHYLNPAQILAYQAFTAQFDFIV